MIKLNLHKNSVKLAGLYLVIIMSISLFFSVSLYNISVREIDRGLRHPGPRQAIIEQSPVFNDSLRAQLDEERESQLNQAREHVLQSLVVINMFILAGAGIVSYYLAYRTLRPIEEAHEAQARFTADASHELRTPIAAMQTETEVALMEPKLTLKQAKQQLTSNLEELAKLTILTEGLLGLARSENAKLDAKNVEIADVLREASDQIQPLASQKHISISMPPAKVSAVVVGDKVLLVEAIVIMLDNAIKYSPKKTAISLHVHEEHSFVYVSIEDHGQGIPAEDMPHIFDRFYRVDPARNKQNADGYGLGLSLARRIAALHNGSITVTSKLGEGSKFTLCLPLITPAAQ